MAKYSVTVDFIDGNMTWREHGTLTIENEDNKKFFMLSNKDGTRVFPLSNRRAEIYIGNSEEAFVVECDYDMANAESDIAKYTPRSISSLLDYGLD